METFTATFREVEAVQEALAEAVVAATTGVVGAPSPSAPTQESSANAASKANAETGLFALEMVVVLRAAAEVTRLARILESSASVASRASAATGRSALATALAARPPAEAVPRTSFALLLESSARVATRGNALLIPSALATEADLVAAAKLALLALLRAKSVLAATTDSVLPTRFATATTHQALSRLAPAPASSAPAAT